MKRSGWSKSASLITGAKTTVVTLSVEFEEPTTFTAQLDVEQGETAGFAIAIVEWTVNGITMNRTIDVAAGASICGVAEAMHVLVKDVTDVSSDAGGGYTKGTKYGVTISVAARTRPTTAVPPIFTALRATLVPPTDSVDVDVPPGANSVAVYGVSSNAPAVLVVEQQARPTPFVAVTVATTVPRLGEFVPLVAGAQKVHVMNPGAAEATVTVCFGIDG